MRLLVLAFLFFVASDPVLARADVTLSSLVGGYCRIGKYTPVEVTYSGAGELLIEVDCSLPVQLRAASGAPVAPVSNELLNADQAWNRDNGDHATVKVARSFGRLPANDGGDRGE